MDRRSLLFVFLLSLSFFVVNNYFFDQGQKKSNQSEITSLEEKQSTKSETIPNKEPSVIHVANEISTKEEFYVLENEYQQVVFSNYGGAIAEINLPFTSPKHPKSIVKTIRFDSEIEEQSPMNARFPLESYYIANESATLSKQTPYVGGYTPLLRRSLKNDKGKTIFKMPPRHYAANLISEDSSDEIVLFKMKRLTKDEIQFEGKWQNKKILKTYRLNNQAPYAIEVNFDLEDSEKTYWVTSGIPEVELVSGAYSPVLEYYSAKGRKNKVETLKLPKTTTILEKAKPKWASNSNGFFGTILDPVNETALGLRSEQISGSNAPTRLSMIDEEHTPYPSKNYPGYEILLPTSESTEYHIFAGPYDENVLKVVDQTYTNQESGMNPNFVGAISIQGWFTMISEPFAKFLFIILNLLHNLTHSWGFSIILLTLILRLILYPLNSWSYKANLKSSAKMQKLNQKVKAVQEKYKNDPKRMNMELAMLYKTEGVNPFGGCLPILIQMPFFIGMLDLLKSTFALRGASFIPGWIDNLTAPDVLFSWNYPIIFFGTSFHLLPFILGGLMFIQSKIGMGQNNDAPMTDQQQQMKSMGTIMTVVFTFFFYNMPSGLNIYWIFSTLFGMLQQIYIKKKFKKGTLKVK